jgi:hypothetical protein
MKSLGNIKQPIVKKSLCLTAALFLGTTLSVLGSTGSLALETTGKSGAPDSTSTISNKQLPAPNPKFGGVIKDDALSSTA